MLRWSGQVSHHAKCIALQSGSSVPLNCFDMADDAAIAQLMSLRMRQHSNIGSSCLSHLQQIAPVHLTMCIHHCCYKLCTCCYKSAMLSELKAKLCFRWIGSSRAQACSCGHQVGHMPCPAALACAPGALQSPSGLPSSPAPAQKPRDSCTPASYQCCHDTAGDAGCRL